MHIAAKRRVRIGAVAALPLLSGVMTGAVKIDVAAGSVVQSKQSLIGYRFADMAQTRVVAVRRDGYAFSRLAPYIGRASARREGGRSGS